MLKILRVDDRYYEFQMGNTQAKAGHVEFVDLVAAQQFIRRVRMDQSDATTLRSILADVTMRSGMWQLRPDEFDRAFALALLNGLVKVRAFRVGWTDVPQDNQEGPKSPGVGAAAAAKAAAAAPPPGAKPTGPLAAALGKALPLGPPSLAGLKPPAVPDLKALVPPNPLDKLKEAAELLDDIKADFLDLRIEIDQALVQTFAFSVNMDFATSALAGIPASVSDVTTAMNAAAAETTKTLSGM